LSNLEEGRGALQLLFQVQGFRFKVSKFKVQGFKVQGSSDDILNLKPETLNLKT